MDLIILDPITARHAVRTTWRRRVWPALEVWSEVGAIGALAAASASLDELLRAEGYQGEQEGERLWHARRSLSDFAAVRLARHVRHRAVHQLNFPLTPAVVVPSLTAFARALRDHGVTLEAEMVEETLLLRNLSLKAIDVPLRFVLRSHHRFRRRKEAWRERIVGG